MLRTGYAVNATNVEGRVSFLDGLTGEHARTLAESIGQIGHARRASWGIVRDGGYYPVASVVCTPMPRPRCQACAGMGRETYTRGPGDLGPIGSLSTRTCQACQGQGRV